MKIPLTLNGLKTVIEAEADTKLLYVLRERGCLSVKCGCCEGTCGSCTALLNGRPVPTCKIPFAIVRDCEIETLEHFTKLDDYQDIVKGFDKAGIHLCGYCNSGKIFAAWDILHTMIHPSRAEIAEQVQHLSPCCTDLDSLVNGIIYAVGIREKRIGVMKNAAV